VWRGYEQRYIKGEAVGRLRERADRDADALQNEIDGQTSAALIAAGCKAITGGVCAVCVHVHVCM
jgi:hypothetical protein